MISDILCFKCCKTRSWRNFQLISFSERVRRGATTTTKKNTEQRVTKKTTNHAWLKLHACMGSSEEDGKKKRILQTSRVSHICTASPCRLFLRDSEWWFLPATTSYSTCTCTSVKKFSFLQLPLIRSFLVDYTTKARQESRKRKRKHIRVKWKGGKKVSSLRLCFVSSQNTQREVAIKQKIFLTNSPVRFAMPKANHFYYSISPTLIPPVWPWML